MKGTLGAKFSFLAVLIFDATQLVFNPCGINPRARPKEQYVQLEVVSDSVAASPETAEEESKTEEPKTTVSLPVPAVTEEQVQETEAAATNRLFLYLSWIMNFGAYGSMAVIANQYIKLIVDRNIGIPIGKNPNEMFLGTFLCTVYLAQMTVFIVGGLYSAWQRKRLIIYAVELLGIVCLMLISFLSDPYALLGVAFGCGLLAGSGYLASYSYSFHAKGKSGKFVGLHEAVLAISSVILPPVAGALVSKTGELRVPYWMCAMLVFVMMIVQETFVHIFWFHWRRSKH